jgi:glucose-1-phosphate thymidylyltransferase
MKGVILAGGLGTRLAPLTHITNKHLLPVYNKPMILYPLDTLRKSGLDEIMIICGKEYGGHFMNFLGSGKEHGVKLSYALQHGAGGIAEALGLAEDFIDGDNTAVILGDNIFENDFREAVRKFQKGARVFFKKVKDPARFGVPVFNESGRLTLIEEKPEEPKSSYAQTGFYLFDNRVFGIIRGLKPSARNELEITDVINHYLRSGELEYEIIEGFWSDAGTFSSLLASAEWAARNDKNKELEGL